MNTVKIKVLPDDGCIVEMDEETVVYTKEEVDEMGRDYTNAIRRQFTVNTRIKKGDCQK